MTDQRVNSILIAMTIMVVSAIVFRISQVSRVFVDIQWQWGRNAMAVFVPISPFTALVSLFVINSHVVFLMAPATEARKLVVETFKYLVYKAAFLPFVVPPTHYQARLWSGWMIIIFCLKMFLAVAKNRIHLLNASPSATPWSSFRFNFAAFTYFLLLVLLIVNAFWMSFQILLQTLQPSPVAFLLLFAPLSIAFETLNAILVQGFQLIDIWLHSSPRNTTNSIISELLDLAVGKTLYDFYYYFIYFGFVLDIMSLLMSLGHYIKIWKHRGMAFDLFDSMIFVPILSLEIAIVQRTWKFITL
ncbi:hypothetical protein LXL04_028555 [Taraxacum kok-saghyz]